MSTTKWKQRLAAAILCGGLTFAVLPGTPVQAIDFNTIGAIVSVGAEYAAVNQQLNYLDNEGRNEFMAQVKEKYGVNQDPTANAMVARIMKNLSASVATKDPSIKEKPYNYFVNNDQSFNAFCTLGHNMSVNIGLFAPLNYNENEVAFVLAHEMGHGQKGHPVQGVKKSMPISLLASLASSGSGAAQLGAAIVSQIGTAQLVTKPMEKQADELAFTYAVGAGYNPGAGAALWQRMLDKGDGVKTSGVMELFNDHPTNVSRRNTYSEDITDWSQGIVKVDADTGTIYIRDKEWYTPASMSSMSSKERAYLIAGNLSAVYHQSKKPTSSVYVNSNNVLCVGNQPIVDLSPEANSGAITAKLQELL